MSEDEGGVVEAVWLAMRNSPRFASTIEAARSEGADAALAHIAAVLRDEATVEAVARAVWLGDGPSPAIWEAWLEYDREAYRTVARGVLAVIADRLGASQPREVAPGCDASTTVDPDATTTEGDL